MLTNIDAAVSEKVDNYRNINFIKEVKGNFESYILLSDTTIVTQKVVDLNNTNSVLANVIYNIKRYVDTTGLQYIYIDAKYNYDSKTFASTERLILDFEGMYKSHDAQEFNGDQIQNIIEQNKCASQFIVKDNKIDVITQSKKYYLTIYSLNGELVSEFNSNQNNSYLLPEITKNFYFVNFLDEQTSKHCAQKIYINF